jgi:hypothetical protein
MMAVVLFILGVCLGALLTLVGVGVVVVLVTRRPPRTQPTIAPTYEEIITDFQAQSDALVADFLDLLTHASKKGSYHDQ